MGIVNKIVRGRNHYKTLPIQPLTGFDIFNTPAGFSFMLVYDKALDEQRLIDSLQRTLDENPYFAGRAIGFPGHTPAISANNEGVLFTCVRRDHAMPYYGFERPIRGNTDKFINAIDHAGFDQHVPLVQIKLTQFHNGAILGFSVSHILCDAAAFWDFLVIWSNVARNRPVQALMYERQRLQEKAEGAGEHPSEQQPVLSITEPVLPISTGLCQTQVFRLSTTFIQHLASEHCLDSLQGISKQDLIMAYLWYTVLRCLPLSKDDRCSLTLVYNVRKLLNLDNRYLGNAACPRFLQLKQSAALTDGVAVMAQKIRGLSNAITQESLAHDLAFWTARMRDQTAHRYMMEALSAFQQGGVLINNWTKFPIYDIDFGEGRPVWFNGTDGLPARLIFLCTAPNPQDGFDVYVTLTRSQMATFQQLIDPSTHPGGFRATSK